MNDNTSRVTAFGIFLIFDGSTTDYAKLVKILIQNGFAQRIPRVGYLVTEGNSLLQHDVENMEHLKKSMESDPERISLVGKYCIVGIVPHDAGKQLVITHKPELKENWVHSNEIIVEVNQITDIIKEKFTTLKQSPLRLFYAVEVKSNKRSHQVLANFDDANFFFTLVSMGSAEMELVRYENEIYLYSRDADNSGPSPIVEDMKRKNLPQKGKGRKRGWDNIILRPRPGQYWISAEYGSDSIDDVIRVFEFAEEQSIKLVSELEAKIQ